MNHEIIYGKNAVLSTLKINKKIIKAYLQKDFKDEKIKAVLDNLSISFQIVEKKYLDHLTDFGNHQGIALEIPGYDYLPLNTLLNKIKDVKNPLILMLDGIEDPHNLGAILRSVDATNTQGVIICKHGQVPLNATVAKVSTGAIEHVDVVQVVNLTKTLQLLKEKGFWIVGAEANESQDFRTVDYAMPIVLVVGSEGKGISPLVLKQCDFKVKIPMSGHVNSLNVSVATALLLYQIYLSRNKI